MFPVHKMNAIILTKMKLKKFVKYYVIIEATKKRTV